MGNEVKVVDLTAVEEGNAAAIIYFENLNGTIHIYRDGTVVLSSPVGTTVAALHRPQDQLWRRTQFLQMLARLGATDQALTAADLMISEQEAMLTNLGFPAAAKKTGEASARHFQTWCQTQGLDYAAMDEKAIEQLLEEALAQVRTK